MTTDVKAEVKSGWSEAEEKVIAAFHESGMTRSNAIRKMRSLAVKGVAPEHMLDTKGHDESPSKAQVAKQDAAIKRVNAKAEAKREERTHISSQKQVHIDELVNSVRGKAVVEATYKSSLSDKFTKYIWLGMSDGRVLSVNPDAMTTRWLDPASKSAKGWLRMQARSRKAEEKAAVKADNKAAKATKTAK